MIRNSIHAKQYKKENKVNVKSSDILLQLSEGNQKLAPTETTAFLIWNITSQKTCPYSTAMCRKYCYAKSSENRYPSVRNRRSNNLESTKQETFVNDMIEEIEYKLSTKKYQGKTVFFRIHESGDFYSYEYLEKWKLITDYFKDFDNIIFMAYTKSLPYVKQLFNEYGQENVNINFKSSIWDDTTNDMIELTNELDLSIFTAMTKNEMALTKFVKCPASGGTGVSCASCKLCYKAQINTAIEIH